MKAKHFLSKNTRMVLKELNLEKKAEELQNLHTNVSEDLPYWMLRLDSLDCSSQVLANIRSLGFYINSTGGIFSSDEDNKILKKSYKVFVEANQYELSREFACGVMSLDVSALKVNPEDAYALSASMRKLIHKAWIHSTWTGDTYENLQDFFRKAPLTFKEKKVMPVQATPAHGCYCLRNGGLWYDGSLTSPNRYMMEPNLPSQEELIIEGMGIGTLQTNESLVPVMNRRDTDALYVAARSSTRALHLIRFEDINVLALHQKLKITRWSLHRVVNYSSAFKYRLSGYSDKAEFPMIKLYGSAPFYTPALIKA